MPAAALLGESWWKCGSRLVTGAPTAMVRVCAWAPAKLSASPKAANTKRIFVSLHDEIVTNS